MSKRIGDLHVRMGWDDNRLKGGIKQSDARIKMFARTAAVAVTGAAVAAGSGLGVIAARSLSAIDEQAKLAQTLGTTTKSVQIMARAGELAGVDMAGMGQATKDLTRRLSQAAGGGGPAAEALKRIGLSVTDLMAMPLDQRIDAINGAIDTFIPLGERAAVAGQLFGEEGSLAMQRIDSATIAQAVKDIDDFGIAVSEVDAAQIETTNDALSRMSLVSQGVGNQLAVALAPSLQATADWFANISRIGGPLNNVIGFVGDNMGRIATIGATAGTIMGGRYVVGMLMANGATLKTVFSLGMLKKALITSGIGALAVGAGELTYQFTRLVSKAGGFGLALGLVGDVAVETWDRIKLGAEAIWFRFLSISMNMDAALLRTFQSGVDAAYGFGNSVAGVFRGAYDGFTAIWGHLPRAMGSLMFGATNNIIAGVEGLLSKVNSGIDGFSTKINDAFGTSIGMLGDVDLGRVANPYEGAGTAAASAFSDAFGAALDQDYLGAAPDGAGALADDLSGAAEIAKGLSDNMFSVATKPMESITAIKDLFAETEDETDGASDAADRLTDAYAGLGEGGADAAKGAKAVAKEVKKTETVMEKGVDVISDAFGDFFARGFKGFKGFTSEVWSGFKGLLSDMVAAAAKSKLMIALGLNVSGVAASPVATVAQAASGGAGGTVMGAAGGGLLSGALGNFALPIGGGLLGGLGGVWAGATSGFAAGGIGGALSGGLGGVFGGISGGLAAGGISGIMGAVGAALPVVGVLFGLFSLFKKKPIISNADFTAVQTGLSITGMELLDTGKSGQYAAKALRSAAGGMDEFTDLTEGYFSNFYSDVEKRNIAIESMSDLFSELDLTMPTTNAGFRDILETLDVTTSSGREAYVALLEVSDAFSSVYGTANDVAASLGAAFGGDLFSSLLDERLAFAAINRGADVSVSQYSGGVIDPRELTRLTEAGNANAVESLGLTYSIAEKLALIEDKLTAWGHTGVPTQATTGSA